jgi:CDP-glycerol glycerophosphotransferase
MQKNKIVMSNFNGKGYGDNPKYIVEEILKRKLPITIVWCVRDEFKKNFPESVQLVYYNSLRAFYEEVTAKVWIDNCRKQLYVRKRKGQFYIQTWHSDAGGTKKVEKDAESQLSTYYVKQAKHDSTLIDIFLSSSGFRTMLCRSAFWYTGEIFEYGSPRDDILFSQDIRLKEKVRSHFSLSSDTKIVFYTPTFRDNTAFSSYMLTDEHYRQILDILHKYTKENWVFLVRLHPNLSEKSHLLIYDNAILNATDYDDIQELMFASDILISDYSGTIFEFALMKKPVFLYMSDYEQYKIRERDFYFDLFSLPFPAALDMDGLIENIINFNKTLYEQKVQLFFEQVTLFDDGKASERVVERIVKEMMV